MFEEYILLFEEHIPQIAIGMTVIIFAFLGGIFFESGNGFVKTIISGNKFASKKQGFAVFIGGTLIMAYSATLCKSLIESFLYTNSNNIFVISIVFIIGCGIYFDKMIWG